MVMGPLYCTARSRDVESAHEALQERPGPLKNDCLFNLTCNNYYCTTAALQVKGTASSVSALRLCLGKAFQTTRSV